MGLGVDDDIDRLQPGEQIRFGSDANVGCFADAGAWMALTAPFRAYVDGRPVPRDSVQLPGWCERVTDESQQADLVTFTAESGGVVWLGRTKTGDVAAIVVNQRHAWCQGLTRRHRPTTWPAAPTASWWTARRARPQLTSRTLAAVRSASSRMPFAAFSESSPSMASAAVRRARVSSGRPASARARVSR